jgi:UDP-2,3-diacylglucosamine hydrolase
MENKRLGIICGAGKFPVLLAESAKKSGYEIFVAEINGLCDAKLKTFASACLDFKLGQISKAIKFFKSNEVKYIALAGLIRHNLMYSGFLPDLRTAKILARLKDMRAETIFGEVSKEFASEGIEMINPYMFLKDFMPSAGIYTKVQPTKNQIKNINFGWKIAKTLANVDVGLTVVVADKAVLAIEAMEGTNECIKRAGKIFMRPVVSDKGTKRDSTGPVVVKVAREKQDYRFDLPVIGEHTILAMEIAGAGVLAVEADKTLFIEKEKVFKLADEKEIALVALKDGNL